MDLTIHSTMDLTIHVVGIPKGQPRARAFVRRGCSHAGVYDPGTADDWKSCVYLAARQAMQAAGFTGWAAGIPLVLSVAYWMPRPKRLKDRIGVPHVCKPDLDNLAKAVKDALTQAGVWADDAQVFAYRSHCKFYADPNEQTGAWITIKEA
jgi:crossover junction endodeoxyribonuclease RusA